MLRLIDAGINHPVRVALSIAVPPVPKDLHLSPVQLRITIRRTADVVIGTFCIEHCCSLLHDDCDFLRVEEHLALITR